MRHKSRLPMTDEDEARYLARAIHLVGAFREIAKNEHPNIVAEAALAFLAEALANHPNGEEMVKHVINELKPIVDGIVAGGDPGGSHQGSA